MLWLEVLGALHAIYVLSNIRKLFFELIKKCLFDNLENPRVLSPFRQADLNVKNEWGMGFGIAGISNEPPNVLI